MISPESTADNIKDSMEVDEDILEIKLQNLKSIDLNNSVVNFYVTNISPNNKIKRFQKIKRLKIHSDDKKDYISYVQKCIDSNNHLVELKAINTDQDNRFFYVENSATDFVQFGDLINGKEIEFVKDQNELFDFNSYVIQLNFGENYENCLFAFKYISNAWSMSKSGKAILGFKNDSIFKIEKIPRFEITPSIDFLQMNDNLFISDIRKFEVAMNFHERLLEKKKEALTEISSGSSIKIEDKDILSNAIGNDKYLMRQLASVHEKRYYNNDVWLTKLKIAATDAGNWKIKFHPDGTIVINEDKKYIKELLTILQNKRVRTVVDGEIFDVDGELIALS